ncbi:MAG: hypothetical protein ACI9MC_003886 [Kiritimatiellia bacterium]|jgi:hypothetical protein
MNRRVVRLWQILASCATTTDILDEREDIDNVAVENIGSPSPLRSSTEAFTRQTPPGQSPSFPRRLDHLGLPVHTLENRCSILDADGSALDVPTSSLPRTLSEGGGLYVPTSPRSVFRKRYVSHSGPSHENYHRYPSTLSK